MNAKTKTQMKLLQFHTLQENQYILDLEELLAFLSATPSIFSFFPGSQLTDHVIWENIFRSFLFLEYCNS